MGVNMKINCEYNDGGVWCKNRNIKRSCFGLGARMCVEYDKSIKCEHKIVRKIRPCKIPPCPNKPKNENIGFGVAPILDN